MELDRTKVNCDNCKLQSAYCPLTTNFKKDSENLKCKRILSGESIEEIKRAGVVKSY